ncbi:MAG TPA: hypothetical protein VMY76_13955 [Gemmatimonadales bacterium]|nr:hypothetical protein [Gemmatimonadales bacterium]
MTPAPAPLYAARRRFGPDAGDRWARYVAWSRLPQLREVVSLDGMLCPALPESLIDADWEYNVHADYLTTYFRSLDYLRRRVGEEDGVNILGVMRNPSDAELARVSLPGFELAGFDVVDVHGDVSALTNCGGFDDVFLPAELNAVGLLTGMARAGTVRRQLRERHGSERHAECDVWAIWRLDGGAGPASQ